MKSTGDQQRMRVRAEQGLVEGTFNDGEPYKLSRRTYLILKATMDGSASLMLAVDAVDSTAMAHPEWDMAEVRTWTEWERAE